MHDIAQEAQCQSNAVTSLGIILDTIGPNSSVVPRISGRLACREAGWLKATLAGNQIAKSLGTVPIVLSTDRALEPQSDGHNLMLDEEVEVPPSTIRIFSVDLCETRYQLTGRYNLSTYLPSSVLTAVVIDFRLHSPRGHLVK
jgi:hypothetical protein